MNGVTRTGRSGVGGNTPFLLFLTSRTSSALGAQMLAVAVGWQMYALTNSAFYLGLVGLVQFLPMLLLTLAVGHVADRVDRPLVVRTCQIIEGVAVLALVAGFHFGFLSKELILAIIAVFGAARAFEGPSMQALMPGLVEPEFFPRAAAWSSSLFETATIIGPALGGVLYAVSPTAVFTVIAALFLTASCVIFFVKAGKKPQVNQPASLKTIFAGISFIRKRPVILGSISLDMFAVLFGGATALLPIYAKTILAVGPYGLGILRSAPAVGALLMSLYLARHPLRRKVGRTMFTAVIVFGLATIVFALSRSFALSLGALVILGAADVISVVIRASLVQLQTPDAMRGRVSAVNFMFIGTSNQLGEFESGLTASWFGVVPAAAFGGIGTIAVVVAWIFLFPALARSDKLYD